MQQRVTVQEGASGVVVRTYKNSAGYQVDAGPMAAAGWIPMSQVETTGKIPAASGILALLGVAVAFFLNLYGGVGIVVIAILIGIASRQRGLVVTYRHNAPPAG